MKNQSALFLGPLVLFIGCNLHDTSYLQAGDPNGRGGRAGNDSGGSGEAGASAGTDNGIGGSGEGGAKEGGSGEGGAPAGGSGEGGDRSMAGDAGSGAVGVGAAGPCDGGQIQCESTDVITDFESNDGHLCVQSSGTVIAYGDGTGTQSPEVGDVRAYDASDDCNRGSLYALHALGAGAEDYGFGVAFRFPQNVNAVEAGYKGIRFKAKVPGDKGSKISIKVALPTTLDASFGGSCEPTVSPKKDCNDHPAAPVVIATGGWLEYQVPFTSLKQEGWGVPAPLNYEAIAQIHVVFPGPISGGSAVFDVWLDDLEFYK